MNIRPIRNSDDHAKALAHLQSLFARDPEPGSKEHDEAEVLTTLVEHYESKRFPIKAPAPLDALKFRVDQLGLKNKDLVPYIGSASKVSEVLNGKRRLSLNMIKNLHKHLGIPAEALIGPPGESSELVSEEFDPSRFPCREMFKRGYFETNINSWIKARRSCGSLLRAFFEKAGVNEASGAYCRSTAHYRDGKQIDKNSLLAWQARVLICSYKHKLGALHENGLSRETLDHIASLSVKKNGPLLAQQELERLGIAIVVERHLPKTYLDGASFMRRDNVPVIGLTIRYDRIDNFWFTLMHELVHVLKHLGHGRKAIFDSNMENLDVVDSIEKEADALAADILIPRDLWRRAAVRHTGNSDDALRLAKHANRHPAIVVGRVQQETHDYKTLTKSIGVGRLCVGRLFE